MHDLLKILKVKTPYGQAGVGNNCCRSWFASQQGHLAEGFAGTQLRQLDIAVENDPDRTFVDQIQSVTRVSLCKNALASRDLFPAEEVRDSLNFLWWERAHQIDFTQVPDDALLFHLEAEFIPT